MRTANKDFASVILGVKLVLVFAKGYGWIMAACHESRMLSLSLSLSLSHTHTHTHSFTVSDVNVVIFFSSLIYLQI
jgi:hypothetical protein